MKKLLFSIYLAFSVIYSFAQDFTQENEYVVRNLDINTEYSDFGASVLDGYLIFTSARPDDNESNREWTNNQPFLDIFKGRLNGEGQPMEVEIFSDVINTKYHESNTAFTKDGKTVYFTRNNYNGDKVQTDKEGWSNLKLYRADVDAQGNWSNVTPLPFNSDIYSSGHPALSPDDNVLYFTSDMPGTLGGTDIFKVDIKGDQYGLPVNLGPEVNTEGQEMFPFVSASKKLYFSTSHGGAGGLDIVRVDLRNIHNGKEYLPEPFNSTSDDFAYTIQEEDSKGYFSSDREGGKGGDDIYYFEIVPIPPSQDIVGVVKDRETKAIIPYTKVTLLKGDEVMKGLVVRDDANFKFDDLDCNTKYKLIGEKAGYVNDTMYFATTEERDRVINIDLLLSKPMTPEENMVEINRCQTLLNDIETIYFDLDESYIRADAAKVLDHVADIMMECNNYNFIVGSHTDARAGKVYNKSLSNRRAKSTVQYLIRKGIRSTRLKPVGYGESRVVNHCKSNVPCSEAEHQQNRRTEFTIITNKI